MEEVRKKNTPHKITFYEFNRRSSRSSVSGSYCWSFGENKMMCRFIMPTRWYYSRFKRLKDVHSFKVFPAISTFGRNQATSNQIQLPSIQFFHILFLVQASISRIALLLLQYLICVIDLGWYVRMVHNVQPRMNGSKKEYSIYDLFNSQMIAILYYTLVTRRQSFLVGLICYLHGIVLPRRECP